MFTIYILHKVIEMFTSTVYFLQNSLDGDRTQKTTLNLQ